MPLAELLQSCGHRGLELVELVAGHAHGAAPGLDTGRLAELVWEVRASGVHVAGLYLDGDPLPVDRDQVVGVRLVAAQPGGGRRRRVDDERPRGWREHRGPDLRRLPLRRRAWKACGRVHRLTSTARHRPFGSPVFLGPPLRR